MKNKKIWIRAGSLEAVHTHTHTHTHTSCLLNKKSIKKYRRISRNIMSIFDTS